eukprot:g15938.t1
MDDWSPAHTLKKVLLEVKELMRDPEHDPSGSRVCLPGRCYCGSSENRQAMAEYIDDREKFNRTAKEWTAKHA